MPTSLIVGSFNKPPAKQILQVLRPGAKLTIQPEPENPYDENAIKVLVDPGEIPSSQHSRLEELLIGTGFDLEEVLAGDPIWLGYVASSAGKPLIKAAAEGEIFQGTLDFKEALAGAHGHSAKIGFSASGKPTILLETWDDMAEPPTGVE